MTMRHIERVEPLGNSDSTINVWRIGNRVRLDMLQPISGITTQDMERDAAVRLANAILSAAGY